MAKINNTPFTCQKDKEVLIAFLNVINLFGSATTLEVKTAIRNKYPNDTWNQSYISDVLRRIEKSNVVSGLIYQDNGTFRVYSIQKSVTPLTPVVTSTKSKSITKKVISRSKAVELIKGTKGKFFTVTFIKKDGSERTINGNVKADKFMNNLGYIQVKENYNKTSRHRMINPKTIKKIKLGSVEYTVK